MSLLTARAIQLAVSTLQGDSTLMALLTGGLFWQEAPQNFTTPFGIISVLTPLQDIQGRAGQLVMARGMLTVKAVGDSRDVVAKLVPAADRMDTLLNTLLGSAGGATVIRVVRDHEIFYREPEGQTGVEYTHAGYVYEWWAQ